MGQGAPQHVPSTYGGKKLMKRSPITSTFELKIEASVKPSESPEKVKVAVCNMIDCMPEFRYGSIIVGKSYKAESLRTIYEQVRSRSAMAVLRRILDYNRFGNTTYFLLNKQAAFAGTVVIIDNEQESPLGPIRVMLDCLEIDLLIDWLVPI
jgi:predicted RNA binding protein with dsRBD fold (UPF0201 family)